MQKHRKKPRSTKRPGARDAAVPNQLTVRKLKDGPGTRVLIYESPLLSSPKAKHHLQTFNENTDTTSEERNRWIDSVKLKIIQLYFVSLFSYIDGKMKSKNFRWPWRLMDIKDVLKVFPQTPSISKF